MPQGSESSLKFEASIRHSLKRTLPGAGGIFIGALMTQVWVRPTWDVNYHVIHPIVMGVFAILGGSVYAVLGTPQLVEVDAKGCRLHRGGAITDDIVWEKITKARLSRGGCWLFRFGRALTWISPFGFSNSQWKGASQAIYAHLRDNRIPVAVGQRAAARWLGQDVHASEL